MTDENTGAKPPAANEGIKADSHFLRGTIAAEMADTSTGAISEPAGQLTKFHGLYLQDDRDLRNALKKAGREKAFAFMLRVRLPGGRATPRQWLALDQLAGEVASPSLRLTTRQTFQFHGVLKGNVKPLIQHMHQVLLDSIAACGDVNRNVMCPPNPERSAALQQMYEHARGWSEYALPKTHAYHEIWLDDELVAGGEPEHEPLYGATYLPRKFKTGFALPPSNDVDVFSQDLGFIAIVEHGPLERLRAVKSPAELRLLRDASDRVIDAMLAVIGSHGPGTIKRQLEAALQREESERGLVFEYALITVGSSHGRAPSNEVWQAGDILSLDSGGNLDGYIGDLCRMAILGEPDAELEDLLGSVERVQMSARAPIRRWCARRRDLRCRARRDGSHAGQRFLRRPWHGADRPRSPAPDRQGTDPLSRFRRCLAAAGGDGRLHRDNVAASKRGFIKLEDTVAVTDTGWEGFGDRGRGWNRGAA